MVADVAGPDRSEQGVGDGVEKDVGVAMSLESALVRDSDPAKPQFLAGSEGVDVEAHPGAARQPRGEARFGAGEIRFVGELGERLVAGDRGDPEAGRAGDLGVVGGEAAAPPPMGGEDRLEAEGLRGLHADQAIAADRLAELGSGPGERVDDGQDRNRPVGFGQPFAEPCDDRRGQEGTRGVVDEDPVGPALGGDRLEPVADAVLPFAAAGDRGGEGRVPARPRGRAPPGPRRSPPGPRRGPARARASSAWTMQGPAGEGAILLGQAGAGAAAAPRRDQKGDRPLHGRAL